MLKREAGHSKGKNGTVFRSVSTLRATEKRIFV